MPLVIPLQAVKNQQVQASLGNQAASINVYQTTLGLFTDLLVAGVPIVQGILSLNANLIVRNTYFGFSGDLLFIDVNGQTDPVYTGLNSRYFLLYLTTTDIAALNLPFGES